MVTDLTRLSDGTYGRELGRVSPEGNIYGTTRWVRDVLRNFWWNGARWLEIGEDIGQSNSVQLLPTDPQDPDTVWRCLDRIEDGKYIWKYFFWDAISQSWQPIVWHWTVESYQELPNNPWFRGQAHEVKEPDVLAMWDGYTWRRLRVSAFDDDVGLALTSDMVEMTDTVQVLRDDHNDLIDQFVDFQGDVSDFREVYNGFVRGFSPEFELTYMSENELSLRPRYNDYDYLTISDQKIQASKRTSVFTFSPVLNWNQETESVYHSTLQPSTEYWVYLANRDAGFNINVYDFRGRLFCSNTEPSNNYLGLTGLGLNAVLIGKCQTSASTKFLYELDVSLVSRTSDLRETFREFSDFDLTYTNEMTLTLTRTYGTYGQMYIPEALYYLGENRVLLNTDKRISYSEEDGLLSVDSNDIEANTLYYCYIAGDTDIFNFNEINPNTGLPWHPEDDGAGDGVTGPYYSDIDFRLRMFLSTRLPEDGRLAETWRAYWARHIGQITTDSLGKFIYAASISSIRQATLSPGFFDGLAEINIRITDSSVIVGKKTGTSGILMVGSNAVTTVDVDDPHAKIVTLDSFVYTYDTDNELYLYPSDKKASYYINSTLNVYMVGPSFPNENITSSLVFCSKDNEGGYLSSSWPGNRVRWLCSVTVYPNSILGSSLENELFESTSGWDNLATESNQSNWYIKESSTSVFHNSQGGSNSLINHATLEIGALYRITLKIVELTAGYITVLGDDTLVANTKDTYTFFKRVDSNSFYITPHGFGGSINQIACELVESAKLNGTSSVEQSIIPIETKIDDIHITSTTVFSAAKVMELLSDLYNRLAGGQVFDRQKTSGIPITFTTAGSKKGRIVPMGGSSLSVGLPDGSTMTIPAAGLTTPNIDGTKEYAFVWLSENGVEVNQLPPTSEYAKLFCRENKVLIAFLLNPLYNNSSDYWTNAATGLSSAPFTYDTNSSRDDSLPYPIWRAFDRTETKSFVSDERIDYDCIQIQSSNAAIVNKISIMGYMEYGGTYAPLNIAITGSNDGSVWTELAYVRNLSYGVNRWSAPIVFANTSSYKAYRIHDMGGGKTIVVQIKLTTWESDTRYSKYRNIVYPITNFYHGPSGANNHSLTPAIPVSVSASSQEASSYGPEWVIYPYNNYNWNGKLNTSGVSFWMSDYGATSSNPQSIMFDYGENNKKCINKYRLRGGAGNYPEYSAKSWKLQGSNYSLASPSSDTGWVDLHTVTNLGYWEAPLQDLILDTYTFSNSTKYRFYRLRITDTMSSSSTRAVVRSLHLIDDPLAI